MTVPEFLTSLVHVSRAFLCVVAVGLLVEFYHADPITSYWMIFFVVAEGLDLIAGEFTPKTLLQKFRVAEFTAFFSVFVAVLGVTMVLATQRESLEAFIVVGSVFTIFTRFAEWRLSR